MPHYLYLITPKNDWTNGEMTEEEGRLMGEHFMYLKAKFEEGKVVLVGPCEDRSRGVGILEADSPEEAEAIGFNDPAVKAGIVELELKEMRISLLRK
ncbi:MAG: YciI family protein [Ignavibacteria bacterium]|nr:YciI family protein [Ignavibacteria bacterium]